MSGGYERELADAEFGASMSSAAYVRDKGHKGPQDQYSFVSIYGDHVIGVMSSVIRASPRDRWPDRVMSL